MPAAIACVRRNVSSEDVWRPSLELGVATIALAVCLAAGPALAQTDARRLEVGGHFSTLRIGDAGNTNAGLGGRVSYELSRWLALEGELSFFPNDRLDVDPGIRP